MNLTKEPNSLSETVCGMPSNGRVLEVASALHQWHEGNTRSFAWRETDEPVHVLIAEILLRKTGADAVSAFLPKFLSRFGTAEALVLHQDELVNRPGFDGDFRAWI
jgi:adenine-specific DNA glycosylase